ncbi:MAG: phage holin family protein [Chloroflexales bacterium]|nr:phage holin family protein [Chloroflexales bacterium]
MRLILRWLITAAAVAIAARFVPGIELRDSNAWLAVLATAAILGLVNAFVRPVLKLLSCGLIVLTLGLFTFVINALMLWLASWIAVNYFGIGFFVDGFLPALLGSIVISVVSVVLSIFLPDDRDERRER